MLLTILLSIKYEKILLFFILIFYMKDIKNIKISPEAHRVLKNHCNKKGIKIYKFIENLIFENCEIKRDIYGDLID